MRGEKTKRALELYDGGMNAHAAAVEAGVMPNAVYVALKKRKATVTCPCCDSKVERLLVPDRIVEQLKQIRGIDAKP